MRSVAEELARNGAFAGLDEVIISAGGSTYFDRVPAVLDDLGPRSSGPHAHQGRRVRYPRRWAERSHVPLGGKIIGFLRPARGCRGLGAVLSRPEPELAIIGFGKRDTPHCEGLPVARFVYRRSGDLGRLLGACKSRPSTTNTPT